MILRIARGSDAVMMEEEPMNKMIKPYLDPTPMPKPEDPLPMPDEPIPDPDIPTPGPA